MITVVFGTRPDAIKLSPVVAALRDLGAPLRVVCTGQHTDLLRGTPAETDLADAVSLNLIALPSPERWVEMAQPRIAMALDVTEASLVVVQGDTASAIAGARAAAECGIPLAHVEAGVRSGCLQEPWPEEGFRREITRLASWHYAATTTAYANLLTDGVEQGRIRLTGNPVVSALHRYADPRPRAPEAFVMLTMHRREWLAQGINLFMHALAEACIDHARLDVLWPMHPHVRAHLPTRGDWQKPANLWLDQPMPYREMIDLVARSCGVATDSGGLVEEAATLGVPSAILRRHNDRPEAVEAGVARQFVPGEVRAAIDLLATGGLPRRTTTCYGQADAALLIARHLTSLVEES